MDFKGMKAVAWALALWGVFSIIFGALILAWPGITLKALLIVFGVYMFASGAVLAVGSIIDREEHWAGGLVLGILSVLAGIYVFANPEISGLVLIYVVAAWALVVGVMQIIAGAEAERDGGWLVFGGIVSSVFGLYAFARPGEGAIALVWLLGWFTVVNGIFMLISAFKVRTARNTLRLAGKK